ncbi:universal stress protein [Streptomyces sp. MUM 178J]|uniref:universal stress protein n=1 Tax=Streptomyces sp. MUM 178J TaxID=2791991 RepID=UPI001F03CA45|nr:universal stress protein [Streptomyces sp. MUM 178J]WRQ78146.1 universal stress protein [Streptomyces sp. MUM 178J]
MTTASENPPVVFGVDAQEPADTAADYAADEAVRRRTSLRLVHAVLPVTHHVRGVEESAHHKALRELGDEALDKATARALERHPGLELSTYITDATPAQVLVQQSRHARLVVVGSRGLGRVAQRLSAYSVAEPVSAHAACPVAVVPEGEQAVEEPPYLVAGVDGSPSGAAALDHALEAAALRGASVRALWVWQPPLLSFLDDERAALEECRTRLDGAVAARADAWREVPVTHSVVRGHPVDVLAEESGRALALVVGRRGSGGFRGMLLGSVPHGLLQRAECPVITVPAPEGGDGT